MKTINVLKPKRFSQRCLVANCRAQAVYHRRTTGRAAVHSLIPHRAWGGGVVLFSKGQKDLSGRTLKGHSQISQYCNIIESLLEKYLLNLRERVILLQIVEVSLEKQYESKQHSAIIEIICFKRKRKVSYIYGMYFEQI